MSDGAVAFVTGGGSGLGLAIAAELGRAGHRVAIGGRSAARLQEAQARLEGEGIEVMSVTVDVLDEATMLEGVRAVESAWGPVALAVHAAGVMSALGPTWEQDAGEWRRDVDTSVVGAFFLARAVLPRMIDRSSGRVVLLGSGVALRPSPHRTAYAAGKAAIMSLAESLAAELAQHGIVVHAVLPGFVETDMTRAMVATPWFAELSGSPRLPAAATGRLIARIAAGDADVLSGRLLHALDDLDAIVANLSEVENNELYVPRLHRLPPGEGA